MPSIPSVRIFPSVTVQTVSMYEEKRKSLLVTETNRTGKLYHASGSKERYFNRTVQTMLTFSVQSPFCEEKKKAESRPTVLNRDMTEI